MDEESSDIVKWFYHLRLGLRLAKDTSFFLTLKNLTPFLNPEFPLYSQESMREYMMNTKNSQFIMNQSLVAVDFIKKFKKAHSCKDHHEGLN